MTECCEQSRASNSGSISSGTIRLQLSKGFALRQFIINKYQVKQSNPIHHNYSYYLQLTYFMIFTYFILVFIQTATTLYCQPYNCYTLLNLTHSATHTQIKKAYRKLALRKHPDKTQEPQALATFQLINLALEILSNQYTRQQYDKFLQNPQQTFTNYYKYYKSYYLPKTNPFTVISAIVIIFSIVQYFVRNSMHQTAVQAAMQTDAFKRDVNQLWRQKKGNKQDIRQQVKSQIRMFGNSRPLKIKQLLIFRILLFPFILVYKVYFNLRWLILFKVLKKEYGNAQKEYITGKYFKTDIQYWTQQQKEQLMGYRVWSIQGLKKYQEFKRKTEEKEWQRVRDSSRYKRYQRFMKKMQ